MREPYFYRQIAEELAKWHALRLPPQIKTNINAGTWSTIDHWLKLGQELQVDYSDLIPEINLLKKEFDQPEYYGEEHSVLAHNDLNPGNVVYNQDMNLIFFLDYEHAGMNSRFYDIANHFCEWSGLQLDFSKFPDEQTQYDFIKTYLKNLDTHPTHTPDGEIEEQVQLYQSKIAKLELVPHIFWAVWARLMAATNAKIFNYDEYCNKRLARYYQVKESLLSKEVYVKNTSQ